MFTQEAINQALTLWLGTAAVGLVFSLIIAFISTRGGQAKHGHHGHEDHHDSEPHDSQAEAH